ncbi:ATP-grasp domain-containing protein [Mucilaginibacter sp. AW1-3]
MYNVLLASLTGFDSTAEIPYIFKQAGCKTVDVYCNSSSWLLSNRFYDNWIESSVEHEPFKNGLIKLVEEKFDHYDWVMVLDDASVKLMNESITDERLFKKILPITKIENREILSSKLGLSNICQKYDIVTPGYINYSEVDDVEAAIKKLKFPILLKEDYSFSGIGIQYCETEEELPACLEKVRVKTNLVLQEFIKGEDIGVEALFREGELITYNCADVLTYMYNKFSFTTRRLYYQSEEVAILLKKLGKSVGLNGFASIQYIYHPERKTYYLIEVDARANAWMPYSRFTGHSFSDGIKQIIAGNLTHAPGSNGHNKKVEIAIFDRDIRRCVKHKDYKSIFAWIFNHKGYWRFIPFYDMKFFKRILAKLFKDFFS